MKKPLLSLIGFCLGFVSLFVAIPLQQLHAAQAFASESCKPGDAVRFYKNQLKTPSGKSYSDVLKFTDVQLEAAHNYIQFLFPISRRSAAQPHTSIKMFSQDAAAFKKDPVLKARAVAALQKMMHFYGFRDAACLKERTKMWVTPGNHNFARITRILTSLRLMGCESEALGFFCLLRVVYEESPKNKAAIGNSFKIWQNAAFGRSR